MRVRQHIAELHNQNISIVECPAGFGSYPPRVGRLHRLAWGGACLVDGAWRALRSHAGQFSWVQREFLSTFYTMERLTKRPRILDVDDAIWLKRGGRAARLLAGASEAVICGNSFIADWFSRWNHRIEIIPTAVNTARLTPGNSLGASEEFIVGWCGTSGSYPYLYGIERALKYVLELPRTRLLVISDREPQFSLIGSTQVTFVPWSEDGEVSGLRQMSVGIMPLDSSDWSRGKCSYKMLSYMACGLPVVVSDLGMNTEVLALGRLGIGAKTLEEWSDALRMFYRERELGIEYGRVGRQVAEREFSLPVISRKLAAAIHSVVD
jgi:glycosyltransferase involved in cell wall biosynthesis